MEPGAATELPGTVEFSDNAASDRMAVEMWAALPKEADLEKALRIAGFG